MKRHSVFNIKLYLDTLRRLRLPGFVMAAATLVISLLPPFAMYINGLREMSIQAAVSRIAAVTPALWGYMYIGGAGLVFAAFSFLNKRNSSDFYHALPNTSVCTWLSTAAAAVTWQAATVVLTVLLTYLAYVVTGIGITAAFLPNLLGYFLAGTLLVSACAAIAVAITGTMLTNVVLTGLILFLPRFILTMLAVAISGYSVIVPISKMGMLFNPIYNIPCIPLTVLTENGLFSGSSPVTYWPGMVYSAVLAILYLGMGLLAYRARRSETAEKSAPNRVLQAVYRCAITVPVLMVIPIQAAAMRQSLFESLTDNPGLWIILMGISALVYFIYESVTTKKFKNILKALPLFVALAVVVPLATWGVSEGTAGAMLSYCPKASSISGVSIGLDQSNDYNERLTEGIVYEDAEMIALCRGALEKTISNVKAYGNGSVYSDNYQYVMVTFKKGLGSFTREVFVTNSELSALTAMKYNYPDYGYLVRKFPSFSEISSYQVYFGYYNYTTVQVTGDEFLLTLRDELSALSDYEYTELMNLRGQGMVYIYGYVGTDYFYKNITINEKTPNTLKFIISAANEEGKGLEKLGMLADLMGEGKYASAGLYVIGDEEKGYLYPEQDELLMLIRELADRPDTAVDMNLPIAMITFTFYDDENYQEYTAFFNITEAQIEALGGKQE